MGFVQTDEHAWADAMRAARRGDEKAYHELLIALVPYLRGLVRRLLLRSGQSDSDCEDVVQEILLAVHLRKQTWNESEPLLPWIAAIARYKTIDAMRRKGRRMEIAIDGFEYVLETPVPAESVSEKELNRMLARLAEGQRKIILAVSVEGLALEDAAQRLGLSEGAARVALHRGLKALAKVYRGEA